MKSSAVAEIQKSIFVAIADHELSIEKQRQYLARLEEFEPYATFVRLDRNNNGYLSAIEIQHFLKDNGLEAQLDDWQSLVKFFDSDEDGVLNYTDYMQIVFTWDDTELRSLVTEREPYGVNTDEYLSPILERELSILFEKELAYHNEIEYLKNSPDYNLEQAFDEIDDEGLNYIDHPSIDNFLRRHGFAATEDELTAIIRRMDVSADAKVSFVEFEEAMRPIELNKKNNEGFKLSNPSIIKIDNLRHGYYSSYISGVQKGVSLSSKESPSKYSSPSKIPSYNEIPVSRSHYIYNP